MNGAPTAANLMAHAHYRRELAALLESLRTISDKEAIARAIVFRRRHGLPCPDTVDDTEYYLAGLHRAALRGRERFGLTPDAVGWSSHWLVRNGYSTKLDEVFAPAPAAAKDPQK